MAQGEGAIEITKSRHPHYTRNAGPVARAGRATSLACSSLCLTFWVQRTKTIIVEKVAAASVVARKFIFIENCSNSVYRSQPDGACFEIAGRWSDAALCGCGRIGALTCPERASVVRASNSAERSPGLSAATFCGLRPGVWEYLEETCRCSALPPNYLSVNSRSGRQQHTFRRKAC